MPSRLLVLSAPLVLASVVGCSSLTEAANTAQQVVEQGSAVVSAATDIAAACGVAAAAWAPGVSPEEARTAIEEALVMIDETASTSPDVPGLAAVQEALGTSRDTLAADPTSTSLGISRSALETACSIFLVTN